MPSVFNFSYVSLEVYKKAWRKYYKTKFPNFQGGKFEEIVERKAQTKKFPPK